MDPVETARAFLASAHPDAVAAVLGGSVAAGTATSTSDLDIVVLYADRPANYTETSEFDGWIVESFIYTSETLTEWLDKEIRERRPVLSTLWRDGIVLRDDGRVDAVRADSVRRLEAGPAPLTAAERDTLRYALSGVIDDLREPRNAAERFVITGDVFGQAVDLLLLHHRRWIGRGKWRVRRLADASDLPLAPELLAWPASRDPAALLDLASRVLHVAGGYLQAGHLRGTRPAS